MREDFLNDIKYKEMQLILEEEENKMCMQRIKNKDLKIFIHNGKTYYEYEGVEKLRLKYEKLRKEINEYLQNDYNYEKLRKEV